MGYEADDIIGDGEIAGADIIGALEIIAGARSKSRRLDRLQRREGRSDEGSRRDARLEGRIGKLLGKVGPNEVLAERTPEVMRNFPMPLGRVALAAGASGNLQQNAQRTIRIQRLVLSSADLAEVDVTGISLGVEQQNATIAATPAEAYDFRAVGTTFRGTTMSPGMAATVGLIFNAIAGTTSVAGVLFGEALQF